MSDEIARCGCGELAVTPDGLCRQCEDAAAATARRFEQGQAIKANLDEKLATLYRQSGLKPREMRATLGEIPPLVLGRLQGRAWGELNHGRIPRDGFGLSGTAGIGKTFALSAMSMHAMRTRVIRNVEKFGDLALKQWITWVSWPEAVNLMRVQSVRDRGIEDVERFVAHVIDIPLLVLDDLGAERLRGRYEDDWAASQLDLIIDGRHREIRPIVYTSQLDANGLQRRYGQRMFSRLVVQNPMIDLGASKDLRRTGGSE